MIIKPQFKLKEYKNGLYLVSTPLGNLKDITYRATEVLQNSDYIMCEDTRVSKILFDKYCLMNLLYFKLEVSFYSRKHVCVPRILRFRGSLHLYIRFLKLKFNMLM